MWLPITVIALSWILNAFMDAIDHGKGMERLGVLWYILKWLSYAIPFGYIMWLIRMPLGIIFILVMFLWFVWIRCIDFHQWDK